MGRKQIAFTLDLDERDEDGVTMRDRIVADACKQIRDDYVCELKKIVLESSKNQLTGAIQDQLAIIMATPYPDTDPYGNKKNDKPKTIVERIIEEAMKYVTEKVNDRGCSPDYNQVSMSRMTYMAKQAAAELIKSELADEIKTIKEEFRTAFKGRLAAAIQTAMAECLPK